MVQQRKRKSLVSALICATGASFIFSIPALSQIHTPNFQLGLPLGVDDTAADVHSDRSAELHISGLFKQGKVQEGLDALDKLLETQSGRPVLWLMRAYGHELQGKYKEALLDFDKAQLHCATELSNDKRMNLNLLLFKGIALNKVGKNTEALGCFEKVIQGGGDPAAYYGRGLAFQDLMQNEKAIASFTEALSFNPNNGAWLEARAFSYCTLGQFDKAVADCTRAIELSPTHIVYETRAWAQHGMQAYDKSVADTDEALKLSPDSVIAYWRRGLAHLALNKSKEAIEDFNKGLAIRSTSLLLRDRALAEVDLRQYDKAIKDATDSMSDLTHEAQPYRIRALALHATGEYKKALDDWNAAIKLESDDPYTFARRGNTYLALAEWDKALADFDQAEKRNPKLALHAEKSRAYRHMKRLPEALKECDAAIAADGKDETAYEARARVQLAMWKNDAALKDADTAISIAKDPKWVSPNEVKALVYSQREQWAKEAEECDKSIAASPEEPAMYVHRAYARHRLGQYEKALSDLDQAVTLEPNADNLAARADAHLYMEQYDAAIADAEEALKKDPESSYAIIARGAALGKKGDKAKMNEDFEKGIKIDKEPAYAHATAAEYYMDMGLHDDAVREYSASVQAEPDNAQLYRWRAQSLLNVGKTAEALEDLNKALSIDANYPVAYAMKAQADVQLGKYAEAITECDKAIALDPACGLAYKNRALAHEKIGHGEAAAADRALAAKQTEK